LSKLQASIGRHPESTRMHDKSLVNDSSLTHAATPDAPSAFLTLYRIRRSAFRQQSMALYRRYGQAIMLFLALFGILLRERPDLLAAPLLHFWRAPGELLAGLAWGALWMALVATWTGIHAPFIRGGALARYCRSLPLPRHTLRLVDLAVLGLALPVLALPFAVALWTAWHSAGAFGADGRFPLYLLLFAALTLTTALAVAFGAAPRARRLAGASLALLAAAPWLPPLLLAPVTLAALAAIGFACCAEVHAPTHGATPLIGRALRLIRLPVLLRAQAGLLFHHHRHESGMRMLLAGLPLLAAWWMIVYAGKVEEARGFLHVACALSVCIASGYFYALHVGGQGLAAWLRSMPFAGLRLALASQVLVLGTMAVLFGSAYAALALAFGPDHAVARAMAWAAAWWLPWLALLGLPVLQRHKDGNLYKYVLATVALIIVFNL
jgi:hypothetical protein